MTEPGAARRRLAHYVDPAKLAFMDGAFQVLIAGAGTGKHAIGAALAYGRNADVLAIDLSRRSLAYAARMAKAHGAHAIRFAQADILGLSRLGQSFDVIEAAGVLHHMDAPMDGWRALVDLLRPGGLMLVGLYSALARREIAALREDPCYPGAECSDDAARAYRRVLMDRAEDTPGAEMPRFRDFYTLNEFRDLALHACEHRHTLPEIEAFLARNGLAFRGFTLDERLWRSYAATYPGTEFPGRLAEWHDFEQRHPRLFFGMYQFWCEKTA